MKHDGEKTTQCMQKIDCSKATGFVPGEFGCASFANANFVAKVIVRQAMLLNFKTNLVLHSTQKMVQKFRTNSNCQLSNCE